MNYSIETLLFAFGITLFSGLSTGIGSLIALKAKKINEKILAAALGFSAGVMIYVSMIEMFAEAKASLENLYGPTKGFTYTTLAFFAGMALIAIIDKLVPTAKNPHEVQDLDELKDSEEIEKNKKSELYRTGLFTALAIAIHNFPEGFANFIGALDDPALGISIGIAIAIHNIPEGISVSVPIFYATGNRRKAIGYSFLSGLSEPLGAVVGYFILRSFINYAMFGIAFALIAGIMVYISFDELLPTAEKYGEHHVVIYGLIAGMAVMALSLLVLH
ncbi:MAG: zinc transporter ZupT [Clostridiales bacterium]|nr:zinc transporter ZupT [Clostridiales bacterium]